MISFVLDVNIWFSLFISGNYDWLVRAAEQNEFEIFSCADLENELHRVLHYPKSKKWIGNNAHEYIFIQKEISTKIEIKHSFKDCRDPNDNYIIDLFLQSKSNFLVTGDNDILSIPQFSSKAISFSVFKKIVREIK